MIIIVRGCFFYTLESSVRALGWLSLVGCFIAIAGLGTIVPINEDLSTALIVILSIMAYVVLGMVAAILLLIGVAKRNGAYFWPYMILTVLGLLGNIANTVLIENDPEKFAPPVYQCLIPTVVGIYNLIHVTSLYQKFGEEERNPSIKEMRMRLA